MGRPILVNLLDPSDNEAHLIVCRSCHTHLARRQDIVRSFPVANLVFLNVVNVKIEEPGERNQDVDELRTLADVICVTCGTRLGSKFVSDDIPSLLPGVPSNAGQIHLLKVKLAQWKLGEQYRNVEANDFEA